MQDPMSKEARLKAMQLLLDYAINEFDEMGLGELVGLLAAAALAVDEQLETASPEHQPRAARHGRIRLVTSADGVLEKGHGTEV